MRMTFRNILIALGGLAVLLFLSFLFAPSIIRLTTMDRTAIPAGLCTTLGGRVDARGCALPYRSGGRECTTSRQCGGRCLLTDWTPDPEISTAVTPGTQGHCEQFDLPPRCQYNVELIGEGRADRVGTCNVK